MEVVQVSEPTARPQTSNPISARSFPAAPRGHRPIGGRSCRALLRRGAHEFQNGGLVDHRHRLGRHRETP